MISNSFICKAFLLLSFHLIESRRYDNFSLYSTIPSDIEHLKFLQNIQKQKYIDAVFWTSPQKLYEPVDLIVSPVDLDLFRERADHYKLPVKKVMSNIQKAFDNQVTKHYLRLRPENFSWENYSNLDDINQWLADLAVKYPALVELESIGKSFEGRDIYVVAVKRVPGASAKVIVEGGIHGHEWISPSFVTYLISALIHVNETSDGNLYDIARRYHWYLIPVLNPDGYAYTHKVDRLWRKNRRPLEQSAGKSVPTVGVDLNRNFEYSFGKYDSSNDPTDGTYCGPRPFSEAETKAVSEFINRKHDKLKFFFSIHGYGQKIIIPYSDRIRHIDNYQEMENYARQAVLRMIRRYGNKYRIGSTYDTLGTRISGESASWVKSQHKVKYVFTFLLRDNGSFGYALPPHEIVPTCEETILGLTQLMTARPKFVDVEALNFSSRNVDVRALLILVLLNAIKFYFIYSSDWSWSFYSYMSIKTKRYRARYRALALGPATKID